MLLFLYYMHCFRLCRNYCLCQHLVNSRFISLWRWEYLFYLRTECIYVNFWLGHKSIYPFVKSDICYLFALFMFRSMFLTMSHILIKVDKLLHFCAKMYGATAFGWSVLYLESNYYIYSTSGLLVVARYDK